MILKEKWKYLTAVAHIDVKFPQKKGYCSFPSSLGLDHNKATSQEKVLA